jgi:hypothetical protein
LALEFRLILNNSEKNDRPAEAELFCPGAGAKGEDKRSGEE